MTDLVTLADLKTALEITGTADDAYLQRQISQLSAEIQTYTHRQLIQGTFTHQFHTPEGPDLFLPEFPVTAVASMSNDGNALTVADYHLDVVAGRLADIKCHGFGSGHILTVNYTAGFNPLPDDLAGIVYDLINARLANKNATAGSSAALGTIKKETFFDVGTVEYVTDTATVQAAQAASSGWNARLGAFREILDSYRDVSRGFALYYA